ncbi:MAG: histidine kinase [Nitrososphaerales archaeon]
MRIRTQWTILMVVFSAMLIIIAVSAILTNVQVTSAVAQGKLAAEITQGASDLSYLSNDYLIYREPQQRARWLTRYAMVSQQVDALEATDPEEQALIRSVEDSARRVKAVFDSVETTPPAPFGVNRADVAQLQVAWSRMGVQTQGLLTDAGRLATYEQEQVEHALALRTVLTYAMIGVFGAFFLVNYLTVQRRVLRALATLRQGAQVIGSGNLDYRIPVEPIRRPSGRRRGPGEKAARDGNGAHLLAGDDALRDEIGELSTAFNAMAAHLKENRGQLQAYARRLVDASENERRTIAHELHDEVGQVMTALKMSLTRLQRQRDLPPSMVEKLEQSKALVDLAIDDLRKLSSNLRPGLLDRGGLAPALDQHVVKFREQTGLDVHFTARGFGDDGSRYRLAPEAETNLYRIAQEALTNAARYARPNRIDVTLERNEHEVVLVVQDDGCGFDLAEGLRKGHLGLLGMRERAAALNGHLMIESAPGKGAKIRVAAPVSAAPGADQDLPA